MKYPWQCKYGGCDAGKAIDSKYCAHHRDEMASRVGLAATRNGERDTASLDLFTPPPERLAPTPAARGQDTSQRAAESNQQKARGQAIVMLRTLAASRAGLTCDALEVALKLAHQTVSARLNQMEKTGWVERTGGTATTRSGSVAKLYTITQRGRDQLVAQAKHYAGRLLSDTN